MERQTIRVEPARALRAVFLLLGVAALLLGGCERAGGPASGGEISADELAARIRNGSPPVILDVRTPEEFAAGHIPGAINIPYDQLSTRTGELPATKSEEIVVHCQSGKRAGMAEKVLEEDGYTNVRDLSGHFSGWQASGRPTE